MYIYIYIHTHTHTHRFAGVPSLFGMCLGLELGVHREGEVVLATVP